MRAPPRTLQSHHYPEHACGRHIEHVLESLFGITVQQTLNHRLAKSVLLSRNWALATNLFYELIEELSVSRKSLI
jgi:hypothetical protein